MEQMNLDPAVELLIQVLWWMFRVALAAWLLYVIVKYAVRDALRLAAEEARTASKDPAAGSAGSFGGGLPGE